jgi:hypothetical protein
LHRLAPFHVGCRAGRYSNLAAFIAHATRCAPSDELPRGCGKVSHRIVRRRTRGVRGPCPSVAPSRATTSSRFGNPHSGHLSAAHVRARARRHRKRKRKPNRSSISAPGEPRADRSFLHSG